LPTCTTLSFTAPPVPVSFLLHFLEKKFLQKTVFEAYTLPPLSPYLCFQVAPDVSFCLPFPRVKVSILSRSVIKLSDSCCFLLLFVITSQRGHSAASAHRGLDGILFEMHDHKDYDPLLTLSKSRPLSARGESPADGEIPEIVRSREPTGGRRSRPALDRRLPPISDLTEIFDDIGRRAIELGFNAYLGHMKSRRLRVVTMCSGTESPLLALEKIADGKPEMSRLQ
jgi:hypothetical protein